MQHDDFKMLDWIGLILEKKSLLGKLVYLLAILVIQLFSK